jgi:archaellum component FlaF (FlaF/FlaG flagellin family)
MGLSTVAATAIIGVSLLMVISIFTGGVMPTLSDYREAFKNMESRATDRVQTSINITTIANTSGVFYDLNVTVENDGGISLETADFTVLINGTNKPFNCTESYLYPGRDCIFTVNLTGTGLKRIKVITGNGISDYGEHTV